jgi:signal transduction histidine kinase
MSGADDFPIRCLLDVGRGLVAGLDTRTIIDRLLAAARELTGAQYAALRVLDERRAEVAQFFAVGVDEATRRAIGELPRGRGVLGVLTAEPRPLRLRDVGQHPLSYGFPKGHPLMRSFLGLPVMIRGQAWADLYLAEKQDGAEFTDADQETAVVLAEWAGAAIENARLYESSERRRVLLERVVRGLEATRDIAVAIGDVPDLERVLELIVKRGRALIDAHAVLLMIRDDSDLVVAASAGHASDARGFRLPIAESAPGQVLERGYPERIGDVASWLGIAASELGVSDAHTALLVPMLHRGMGVGVLAAFDRGNEGAAFSEADEQLLQTFAASAANAVAIARSVEADRLRSSMAAADAQRARWARELHDETLQTFGGLRVQLSGALRRADPTQHEAAIREAAQETERGIEALRAIISELRPAALDELVLKPAIEALVKRSRRDGLEIATRLELPDSQTGGGVLDPELESTVYRLIQEALTNVVKHAHASSVKVTAIASNEHVTVEIEDDGVGFDAQARTEGFGLAGMRERAYLAGGTLRIDSGEQGSVLRFALPVSHRRELRHSGRKQSLS